jgi:hypothetical protein
MEFGGVVAQAVVVAIVAESCRRFRAGAEFVLPLLVEKRVKLLGGIVGCIGVFRSLAESTGSREEEQGTQDRDSN